MAIHHLYTLELWPALGRGNVFRFNAICCHDMNDQGRITSTYRQINYHLQPKGYADISQLWYVDAIRVRAPELLVIFGQQSTDNSPRVRRRRVHKMGARSSYISMLL